MPVQAGNRVYKTAADIPGTVPIFPLTGALLLPRGHMPLNIFEPRYIAMIDDALAGDRLIGMIQPSVDGEDQDLCQSGCLGRINSWSETGDGRYMIGLVGVARFQLVRELDTTTPYRQASINVDPFHTDFEEGFDESEVNRKLLLDTFRDYLDANNMEADWDSIHKASTESLVNALSMMSPYGPREKQALLEAPDLKTRAETLIAITEVELARESNEGNALQ